MPYNDIPYGSLAQESTFPNFHRSEWNSQESLTVNHLSYAKQQVPNVPELGPQRVLVNPHFKANSKVFVNPNFTGCTSSGSLIHVNPRYGINTQRDKKPPSQLKVSQNTKIHINPNAKSVHMPFFSNQVYVNPNFKNVATTDLGNITTAVKTPICSVKENVSEEKLSNVVVLTRTKLIRTSHATTSITPKRRHSVKSKYKIIKTGLSPKKNSKTIPGLIVRKSRFKIDNRRKSLTIIGKRQKRCVYVNKLGSTSELTKSRIIKNSPLKSIKNLSLISINGIAYRKSRNSLKRTNIKGLVKQNSVNSSCSNKVSPKGHKIVREFKIIRKQSPKKKELKKLKKCNIPCPSFKKYGACKGKGNGKCIWKHDPDQIALCTRFLQGACLKANCLLSHNVSPEKMPTCKYYLEGSCSRETCPYLHVKISPKAEVCRDFLEGFCKHAAECNKRHQYLCPDYEKYGECGKQRCAYPHGKMVRTYFINKSKFAKKSSDNKVKSEKTEPNLLRKSGESKANNAQSSEKKRYYTEEDDDEETTHLNGKRVDKGKLEDQINLKNFVGLRSRPKLGSLPAFIPFKDS